MSGYTANGKRSVKTIYGKTERECIIKLGAFLEGRPIGSTSKVSSGTVGEFLDAWLVSKEGTIRASTLSRYAELCRNHLKSALGTLRTARLTPSRYPELPGGPDPGPRYPRWSFRASSGTCLIDQAPDLHDPQASLRAGGSRRNPRPEPTHTGEGTAA